jgi:hypothetical protein
MSKKNSKSKKKASYDPVELAHDSFSIALSLVDYQMEKCAEVIQNKILDEKKKPYVFGALMNM